MCIFSCSYAKQDFDIEHDLSVCLSDISSSTYIDSYHYCYYDKIQENFVTNPGWKHKKIELKNAALLIIDPWKDSPFLS